MSILVCKKCSSKYFSFNNECPICNKKYNIQRKASQRKIIIGVVLLLFVIILFIINNYLSHLCWYEKCYKYANDNFCSEHEEEINSTIDALNQYYEYFDKLSNLKISNVKLDKTYSKNYYKVSGSLTNNGEDTVYYVKIKVLFKDSSGDVVDTDWTYAAGSEGLASNETVKWDVSVKKDYSISTVSAEIIDFDE